MPGRNSFRPLLTKRNIGSSIARPKTGSCFPVQFSATLLRRNPAKPLTDRRSMPVGEVPGLPRACISAASCRRAGSGFQKIEGTQFILASPIMHKFMTLVDRVAGHTETVLVTGETGTGKELIARTIHESSLSSRPPVGRHQLRRASRKIWWRANCSVMKRVRSAGLTLPSQACLKWPTEGRCSSTKSANCNCTLK